MWAPGQRYTSDPHDSDSDDDGMLDGDELGMPLTAAEMGGWASALPIQVHWVLSNPSEPDSDFDGLTDPYEKENGSYLRRADSDHDGLTDYQETQEHGTEPMLADSDVDDVDDFIELMNMDRGQDPLIYNSQLTIAEYAGDFARGALCGEKVGVAGFCDGTTIPYLAGSIAAGFVGVGDIRDAIASVWDGNYVIAGLSLAAFVPVIGDSGSVVVKCVRFLQKLMGAPGARAASMRGTSVTASAATAAPARQLSEVQRWVMDLDIDRPSKLRIIEFLSEDAITKLRAVGADEDWLIQIARRGTNLKQLDEVLAAADAVRKAPAPGQFAREKDAENLLRQAVGGEGSQQRFITSAGKQRYPDVYHKNTQTAFEVKHGNASGSGRASGQLQNDVALIKNSGSSRIRSVEWHFYADTNGRIGPDADLLGMLQTARSSNLISFTIWVP